MPCYGNQEAVMIYTTYPKGCPTTEEGPFTLPLGSHNLYYSGPELPNIEVETLEDLTTVLQKIDIKLTPESIFDLFLSAIDDNPDFKTALCERIATCS